MTNRVVVLCIHVEIYRAQNHVDHLSKKHDAIFDI
jgi:hypothetical protein